MVSVCVSDCDDANKWTSLISMVLFSLSNAKCQRRIPQTQSLTVNGSLMGHGYVTCNIQFHAGNFEPAAQVQ